MTLKKYAPEIMMVTGAGLVTAGTVIACVRSKDVKDDVDKIKNDFKEIKEDKESGVLEGAELRKEICSSSLHAVKLIGKRYALPAGLFATGMVAMFGSNNIRKKRMLAAAAVAEATQLAYNKYRENVRAELGEEKDRQFATGYKEKKAEREVLDEETGEIKKEKTKVKVSDGNDQLWTKLFGEANCPGTWRPFPGYNKMFITQIQAQANDRLKRENYLYLKDVLLMLGYSNPVLEIGGRDVASTYGWVHCFERQDIIDFGLADLIEGDPMSDAKVEFLREKEPSVWLEFNVSGDITKLVPELMYREALRKDCLPWDDDPE